MFDFGIGYSEIFVIAVVAIVVIGPKDLPHVLRALGKTLVFACFIFAAAQALPESAIFSARGEGRIDEHAVVLADDLVAPIAHRVEKIIVGIDDRAVQIEMDDGLGLVDGGDLPLEIGAGQLLPGNVGGELHDLIRLAVAA